MSTPEEPVWRQMLKLRGARLQVQHIADIRQDQCLSREYLLRRPKVPLPRFLHATIAYQSWVTEDVLSQEYPERKPASDFAPLSAALPYFLASIWGGEYLCWKCRQIDFNRVFSGGGDVKPLTLPYTGGVLHSDLLKCKLCKFLSGIVKALSQDPIPAADYGPGDWTLDVRRNELVLYHGATRRGQIRRRYDANQECNPETESDLQPTEASTKDSMDPYNAQRHTLDVPKVRQWLASCEEKHEGICRSCWPGGRYKTPIMLYLIDVQNQRLVEAKSSERYVALSYVWGKSTTLLTQTSNLQALRSPGALSPTNTSIARVIRHAMMLVADLGERYLWADTLCIVQDDSEEKMKAINNMDVIYGHALLTIVAASGLSAEDGLPGVADEKRPLMSLSYTVSGFPLVWRGSELSDTLRYSQYETRGWTLQEKLISRRCLFLSRHQAYFLCSSSYECEDYHDSKYYEKNEDHGQPFPIPDNPLYILYECMAARPLEGIRVWSYAIYAYNKLIRTYTKRELSYAGDAINAFQGIIGIVAEFTPGGFVSGLPEDIFDMALLWVPATRHGLTRRKDPSLSSWSWAGWKGEVKYYQLSPVHLPGTPADGKAFPDNDGKVDQRGDLEKVLTEDELLACRNYEFKFRSEVHSFTLEDGTDFRTINVEGKGKLYGSINDHEGSESVSKTRTRILSSDDAVGRNLHPPLIHFIAETIPVTNLTLANLKIHLQYPGNINLYFQNVACGMLYGDYNTFGGFEPRDTCTRQLVLLSRMPTSMESSQEKGFDKRLGNKGWYMCNVMLIEKDSTRAWAERVAVGVIHSLVWALHVPQVQHVTLG